MPNTTTVDRVHLSPEEELQLIAGLLSDEADAWRQFTDCYSRVVRRCISRVLNRFGGITTEEDAREVYSTFCLQLVSRDKLKLRSFDPSRGTRLSTWLGMLSTHAAYDFLRSRRRDPKTEECDQEPPSIDVPSPFDICAVRERARQVTDLLGSFSDKDRQFVVLYFQEGLEPEQVAERMGISVKTVYSKKHKIRSRLMDLLDRRQLAA